MRQFLFLSLLFILPIWTAGCATFQVSGQVQSGRRALLHNDPEAALTYLLPAADTNPQYIYSSMSFHESVWTYIGRAQYALGRFPEARQSLERALSTYKDDAMAQLYLGLVTLRSGERSEGRKQILRGLQSIADWIEYLNRVQPYYAFWDPNGDIRKEIERARGLIEGERMGSDQEIIESAEWVGKQMEEEIDKVRTDRRREFERDHDFPRRGLGVGIGIGF